MSTSATAPWVRHYALFVGGMDTVTGVLLVLSPELVLRLMLVRELPAEPVWLRFIGGFVAGVGLTYLHPLVSRAPRRVELLAATLELTAIVRGSVGLVVAACIARGALTPAWLSVALTDLALAAFQIVLVRRSVRGAA